MSDSDFHKIEKLLSYKIKPKGRTYIQDGDLQIHVTTAKDAPKPDPSVNFQHIYAHFLNEPGNVRNGGILSNPERQGDDLKLAMDDAKNAFDSMMQIREQLNEAYKDFMQMQS